MRRLATLLSVLLLLTGAVMARAELAINGLDDDDVALLTASGMDADTLHFDMSLNLNLAGDPTLAMGINLAGPGAFGVDDMGQPLMTLDLAGTSTDPAQGELAALLRLRLVDNTLYLLQEDGGVWQAMPLQEALAGVALPGDMSEIAGAQAVDFLGWLEFLGLEAFSSGTRTDADGMATVAIEVDLGAWLVSPGFSELVTVAGDATDDETLATLGPMLGMLLQDLLLTIGSTVELDGGLMRQLSLDLGLSVNSAMLGGSGDADPSEISLSLSFANMRYDGVLEVSAPEGAIPAEV